MRIELNLPALERLIGGDTEIELHLRKQIVEEFAKRHLRAIVEDATHQKAMEAAKNLVNAAAKEVFDIENVATNHIWPTVGYRMKNLIEDLVKNSAQKIVDEILLKTIEYQKLYWRKEITVAIDKALNRQIEKEVEEGIKSRLAAAMCISQAK